MKNAGVRPARSPGATTCVVLAALWAGLAVWFTIDGPLWPGIGAGALAAAWLIAAARRRTPRTHPTHEPPPTTAGG